MMAEKIRWPNSVRLKMIDKSEWYSEPRVYQYGYYDGYQENNEEVERWKRIAKMLYEDVKYGHTTVGAIESTTEYEQAIKDGKETE